MAWYTGDVFYDTALLAGFAYVLMIVLAAKFGQAAYGRFGGRAPGIKFAPRLGWMLMELPAPLVFLIVFCQGQKSDQLVPLIFLGIWIIHYIIGIVIYAIGFALNVHSDAVVRHLRPKVQQPGQPRYKIPYGGGYRFVSSPSYLGEMLSWLGFAIFTWSLAGVFILLVTMANLVPRALATHRWYQKQFEDYPQNRKALIPYLI